MSLPGRWVWFGFSVLLLVLIRFVEVRVGERPADRSELPPQGQEVQIYALYGEAEKAADHIPPSGWKWDITMMQINTNFPKKQQTGSNCIKITYQPIGPPKEGMAEIFWQLPDHLWGDNPGINLAGPSRLVFWARGRNGGEQAEFNAGGFEQATRLSTGMIILVNQWREYEIPLAGLEVNHLIAGFCFKTIIPQKRAKSTIYLDSIRLELAGAGRTAMPAKP